MLLAFLSSIKIFLIEFNKDSEFKLNNQELSIIKIKEAILQSKKNDEEYLVVVKGTKDTDIQNILNVIADLKRSNINEITLGISKKDVDDEYEGEKKKVDLPLLRKL